MLALELQLTQGFFDQYRTVALRYTHQGLYGLQLESVSSDGQITLVRTGRYDTGSQLGGAVSSDMIFINLPVTQAMPERYTVQIHH